MPIDLIWLEAHLPGLPAMLAGYILIGHERGSHNTLAVSLHKDWSFIPSEDRDVLAGMEDYLRSLLEEDLERGLSTLSEASNVIRCSDRLRLVGPKAVEVSGLSQQLDRLLLSGARGELSFSASA